MESPIQNQLVLYDKQMKQKVEFYNRQLSGAQ